MTIRAVIFDLGGVLVRTEDFAPRERLAQSLGVTRTALEDLVFAGESGDQAQRGEIDAERHWDNLRQMLGLSSEGLKAFVDDFFAGDRLDVELVDHIRRLRPDYKTGLLSNAFSNLRHFVTDVWMIADAFDEMIISAEVGMTKPDARIYRLALERLNMDAFRAVFVDDFMHNVEAARAIGMQAIHFQNREQAWAELEQLLKGV
jgi:epoxide hydrolase-like predicted phosphatase